MSLFYYLNVFVVSLKLTGALLKYSCASPLPPLVFISVVVFGTCLLLTSTSVSWCRRRRFSASLLEILTPPLNVEEVVSQTCYAQAATRAEPEVGLRRLLSVGCLLKERK